jgi:hypothetical protein
MQHVKLRIVMVGINSQKNRGNFMNNLEQEIIIKYKEF